MLLFSWAVIVVGLIRGGYAAIEREFILQDFNVHRTQTRYDTPLQVGNGNFAFGLDITGLQSIKSFNTLSDWALREPGKEPIPLQAPRTPNQELSGQNVSAQVNLGRIGFLWDGRPLEVNEIEMPNQTLNLSAGHVFSKYSIYGNDIEVQTVASPSIDAIGVFIRTDALINSSLSIFLDFSPGYSLPGDGYNSTIQSWSQRAQIKQQLEGVSYYANLQWMAERPGTNFSRVDQNSPRFILNTKDDSSLELSVRWSQTPDATVPSFEDIKSEAAMWWKQYWYTGAFLDCSATNDPRAKVLQQKVILSQYIMAVNAAGTDIPRETGLLSIAPSRRPNIDAALWHLAHWERWSRWERIGTAIPSFFNRRLQPANQRATDLGFKGARWGQNLDAPSADFTKQDDTHLWQEAHPFYLAELEYNAFPTERTLKKWHHILEETVNYIISYVQYNSTTQIYNLESQVHSVTGKVQSGTTRNSAFELAYWRFGLNIAQKWYQRQGLSIPNHISKVYSNLAHLPTSHEAYITHEGATDSQTESDASLMAIFGFLPPDPALNISLFHNTVANVYRTFNASTSSSGTDFALLAMSAVRMGDADKSIDWLTHASFKFDDAGYPVSNGQESHLSSSGGLLLAVAMLADGWKGDIGRKWPRGWICEAEGFTMGI